MQLRTGLVCFATFVLSCGPAARQSPGDDDSSGQNDAGDGGAGGGGAGGGGGSDLTCVPQGSNAADAGSGCGTVNVPLSMPLALPDTNQGNENGRCTTDSQCTSSSAPTCVVTADTEDGPGMCALANIDTLDFIGFCPNETLDDPSKLVSVCATLEHTWVGDLEIDLISPDGKVAALHQFIGRTGGAIMLGHPNYCDSDADPIPGSGYTYCWTNSATVPMLNADHTACGAAAGCENWAGNTTWCPDGGENDGLGDPDPTFPVVPAGNYKPDQPFASLQGAQLNGNWSLRITDLWAIDNGYLFNWSIQFDPSLLPSCGGPIIQ